MSLHKRDCLKKAAIAKAEWEKELPHARLMVVLGVPNATKVLDMYAEDQRFWEGLARLPNWKRLGELRRRVAEDKRKTATDGA